MSLFFVCFSLYIDTDAKNQQRSRLSPGGNSQERIYHVSLAKSSGQKLGLDVDYMAERGVLPILEIKGGLAEKWNKENPTKQMNRGAVSWMFGVRSQK